MGVGRVGGGAQCSCGTPTDTDRSRGSDAAIVIKL